MAKQSSVNLDITNNSNGFDISGGTTSRTLGISGGNITVVGSGSATLTFPTTSDTLVGRATTDTLTNKTLTSPVISTITNTGTITLPTTTSTLAILGANTFTGLQSFNSGISASGGLTFSNVIISTGYQISSGAINAQTASYGLTGSDNGKIVTMNVTSANNLTVPAGLPIGFNCTAIQLGAGQTTILASGVTLNSYQGYLKISGQHGSASIVSYTTDVYNVAGNLSA